MVKISEATRMAMRIAFLEAYEREMVSLTGEHILIGICSLYKLVNIDFDDFKAKEELGKVNINEEWYFNDENNDVADIFFKVWWDRAVVIDQLRNYMISHFQASFHGPTENLEKPIADFRWENNDYIDKARAIALQKGHNEVYVLHLLLAVMERPDQGIVAVLGDHVINSIYDESNLKLNNRYSTPKHTPNLDGFMQTPYLAEIGTDLTQLAYEGKIEPLIGREEELLQLVRTLNRKKKNNPLLIGEAGVGKTALVRALAQKIADGKVPSTLSNKRIYEINMQSIVSGTKYRGELEEKMRLLLKEAKNSQVILFIDEFHTVVGAGLAEGTTLDVSNMIKPPLENGELTCIGATTLAEYRRYVEKDQALVRRFHPLLVSEPSPEETLKILDGLRNDYIKHYTIRISDTALEAAVKLSVRYLHHKKLPDKALDLLDDACVAKIVQKDDFHPQFQSMQEVDEEDVVKVVEKKVGVPIKLHSMERESVINLDEKLKQQVIGQDHAIKSISRRLKIARAGLKDPKRPQGVFLFMGSTGVGKTLLAKSLARELFGKEKDMIRLDMSEYMDQGSLYKLIGAPPGFRGNEEGVLTSALRTKPYSVVLLDEMEKANPSIFDLFLQVFDEGMLTDGKGIRIDARNAIFIMTSNLPLQSQDCGTAYGAPASQESQKDIARESLLYNLRGEFVNRIDEVIIFNYLNPHGMKKIARNMLTDFKNQLREQRIVIEFEDSVADYLARVGYDKNFGARPLKRAVEDEIKYPLSEMIINKEITSGANLWVKLNKNQIFIEKIGYKKAAEKFI